MAMIYPGPDGILSLSQQDVCNYPVTMVIPNYLTDSQEFINLKFQLYRFLDKQTLAPLIWKVGGVIQGCFRGIPI